MAFSFELAIETLIDMGVDEIILPFILIFTIIYAILQKVKIFGENSKNFNIMIALVLSLIPIFYHFSSTKTSNWDVIYILTTSGVVSQFSTWLVVVVMLLILMGSFGVGLPTSDLFKGLVVISSVIIIGYIFTGAASSSGNTFEYLDDGTKSAIVVILMFGLIIWFVTSGDKSEKGGNKKNPFIEGIEKLGRSTESK